MKTLKIKTVNGFEHSINCNDSDLITIDGKVIFVDGKKYVPKKGDIICSTSFIYIVKDIRDIRRFDFYVKYNCVDRIISLNCENHGYSEEYIANFRIATEAEKQILFDALAKDGKIWNPDTIEIEELIWKPKENETYYFFNSMMAVCNTYFDPDNQADNLKYKICNYFKTESECQEKIEQIKAILK